MHRRDGAFKPGAALASELLGSTVNHERAMDLKSRIKLVRTTKKFNSDWYRSRYPDVGALGMESVTHYLKYGAALGRDPGRAFDARYYLATYPDSSNAESPLEHYALHGRLERWPCQPEPDADRASLKALSHTQGKLHSLGFTRPALDDLEALVAHEPAGPSNAHAARALAFWYLRMRSQDGYSRALHYIDRARSSGDTDAAFQRALATAELLCCHGLGDAEGGKRVYERAALAGQVTHDMLLAWSNLQPTLAERCLLINQVLRAERISPIALSCDTRLPAYDRLDAEPDSLVEEGPRVSVLVAAYQAAGTIVTALRSLMRQSWRNLEIVVIDDCSPDDTAAVVRDVAASDPRIRLIRMERNGGAYVARNHGLDLVTGDYVTIHDADDWSHPAKIETQVRFLETHPQHMACTSEQARATPDLRFERLTVGGRVVIANTSSLMFRRAPMRETLGYWDTVRFSADSELVNRMRLVWGHDTVVDLATGPLSFQRDADTSITNDGALGLKGFLFGARREYLAAQKFHHQSGRSLKYEKSGRPFPVPALMTPDRPKRGDIRQIDLVMAGDFRSPDETLRACAEEIRIAQAAGLTIGLFEMFRYDQPPTTNGAIAPQIRSLVDGSSIRMLVYGENVNCRHLIVRDPRVLHYEQRYLPTLKVQTAAVLVGAEATGFLLQSDAPSICAAALQRHFAAATDWYPLDPLAAQQFARLAEQPSAASAAPRPIWPSVIHLASWQRPPNHQAAGPPKIGIIRHEAPQDRRPAWCELATTELAGYEVHLIDRHEGRVPPPDNLSDTWTWHPYEGNGGRSCLADLDIFLHFDPPEAADPFARPILEAMATGIPVIAAPCFREVYGDAALYVTPDGAQGAIAGLLSDQAAAIAQVKRATEYVARVFGDHCYLEFLCAAGLKTS
ncbi:glycosyltransferase [Rhizobium sp. TRM95111]|uniref:glycosyltransferase family 2 protein n=1 Tax=Rhizobium alarense TaxID=2846851 RepID=UPI001F34D6F2|nr:glycosyltransferase family 2 protein [Rhizobium alarense]MCF3642088.1 glycosyltransferase [Rhizobium alarense]